MNILHICSSSNGGAAVAATRLSLAQQNMGDRSHVVTVEEIERNKKNIKSTIRRKAVSVLQRASTHDEYGVITPISFPYLSESYVNKKNPDVVHIHNWYNILDYKSIYSLSQKYPIVFTMHDERLITGGCHNTLNCEKHNQGCLKCPASNVLRRNVVHNFKEKINLFKEIQRYSIITPSDWMKNRAIESKIFSNVNRIEKIPNIIQMNLSTENQEIEFQEEIATKILFVAADINVHLKGFHILAEAFSILTKKNPNKKYILTAVGASEPKNVHVSDNARIEFKYSLNQAAIQKLFAESSILVVPSLAENAPNIIAEAQLNGLVVLGTEVGGIPEMIKDGETGFLATCNSSEISKKLAQIDFTSKDRLDAIKLAATEYAIATYCPTKIYKQHKIIYEATGQKYR